MAGSLFPASSPAPAFPREDCEVGIGAGRLGQRTGPWRPGSLGCSGELEGEEAVICGCSWPLRVTTCLVGPVRLLLCADLKGNYNCMLVHSTKALRSPAAT